VSHTHKAPNPPSEPAPPPLESLVDYARLAPSTRNTQPWSFAVRGDEIQVFVDRDRWLRVADPDQRELYLSAGCALENLLVAGAHHGYKARVSYVEDDRADGLAAVARFETGGRDEDRRVPLFGAIGKRQTNRRPYRARPLTRDVMAGLYAAVHDEDVQLWLFTDAATSGRVGQLLGLAERTQYADPAYRAELAESIGTGVFGHGWLEAAAGRLVVKHVDVGGAACPQGGRPLAQRARAGRAHLAGRQPRRAGPRRPGLRAARAHGDADGRGSPAPQRAHAVADDAGGRGRAAARSGLPPARVPAGIRAPGAPPIEAAACGRLPAPGRREFDS
jgi:nitroreductase